MAVSQDSWVVQLNTLEGGPGERRGLKRSGVLEDLSTSAVSVAGDSPVEFDGAVEWIDGGRVVLTGTVTVGWTGECRRCLGDASGTIRPKVREIFEPEPTEGETYELRGDVVDIEPMVREAVALDLPLAPVCREGCAGLCAQCGADRNETSCGCDTSVRDPRWAALDVLELDD